MKFIINKEGTAGVGAGTHSKVPVNKKHQSIAKIVWFFAGSPTSAEVTPLVSLHPVFQVFGIDR